VIVHFKNLTVMSQVFNFKCTWYWLCSRSYDVPGFMCQGKETFQATCKVGLMPDIGVFE